MRIDGEVFALELHGVEESILRLDTGIIDVLQRNTSIGATMAMSGTAIIGMFFSEFVRNAALDNVEEAADVKAYNEALMEDDATRYSMDDVMHMAMEAE